MLNKRKRMNESSSLLAPIVLKVFEITLGRVRTGSGKLWKMKIPRPGKFWKGEDFQNVYINVLGSCLEKF